MSTKFPCRFLTDRLMQQHADCLSRLFSLCTIAARSPLLSPPRDKPDYHLEYRSDYKDINQIHAPEPLVVT
jgi:hypothetical protein